MSEPFKSGFIGLVGPTNSGKSTLLNALVGEKISIVSSRAQTTYHGVRGILNVENAQLVFVDMPGYQKQKERMARMLNDVADRTARQCDLWVWLFDASGERVVSQIRALEERVLAMGSTEKRICLLNKVDKISKPKLLPILQAVHELGFFAECIPLSALREDGFGSLVKTLKERLPEGPALFPNDLVTDRSEQFLVSEFIREKLYEATRQEIPYSAWVEIEGWEKEGRVPTIRAVIHVDSSYRKGILIGRGGDMLKRIGTLARADAEKMLGEQICLKLHVDVDQEWRKNGRKLISYLEIT